ncbi:hypothetical protein C4571_01400 [Candidatus Parcubacteria bacterium]|nr:MAG: hypothetical protein C4571_01400 [Candidatus Parcubacteria bacterium]
MNIVIPLAGKDPRFVDMPKALVDVCGKLFIAHILKQLRIEPEDRLIFVVLEEDVKKFNIDETLKNVTGKRAIIRVLPRATQGSPCSILEAARDLIDNETDLLIELGDVLRDVGNLYQDIADRRSEVSGIIPVERRDMTGRLFGYVRADEEGFAEALLEKEATYVAPWATMGLYYFSRGKDFVWAAEEMIRKRSFVHNDMFFVGPVYNELVKRGDKVILSQNTVKAVLGSPEEVEAFHKQCV